MIFNLIILLVDKTKFVTSFDICLMKRDERLSQKKEHRNITRFLKLYCLMAYVSFLVVLYTPIWIIHLLIAQLFLFGQHMKLFSYKRKKASFIDFSTKKKLFLSSKLLQKDYPTLVVLEWLNSLHKFTDSQNVYVMYD